MAQFSEQLPVKILGGDVARTVGALQSTRAEELTASLTSDSAGGPLTLTLSDFGPRLLLLQHTISAASYAELRERQALRVEFARFSHQLSQLLLRPKADASFLAVLSNDDDGYRFEVVQLSDFRLLTHIELTLQEATPEELLSAVAAHARDAENALAIERAALTAERQRVEDAEGELNTTRAELSTIRADAEREARELVALRTDFERQRDELERIRDELDRVRPLADALPAAQRASETARTEADRLRAENERFRDASERLPDVEAAVRQLSGEIHAGNATIERLRTQLTAARERDRVRNEVMERQESANSKQADELRRERDARAAAEADLRSLRLRFDAARREFEEERVIHAHDKRTIAFLNRELNHREALMQTPTPDLGGLGPTATPAAGATTAQQPPLPARTTSAARRRSGTKSRDSTPRDRGRRTAATPAVS